MRLSRAALAKADAAEALFDWFDVPLKGKGCRAMASAGSKRFPPEAEKETREGREGGRIIGAAIAPAPKQHNPRAETEPVKEGGTPEEWARKPANNRQKEDARGTKKRARAYLGDSNRIGAGRRRKLARRYGASAARLHDSRKLEDVLDAGNAASEGWAGSASREPRKSRNRAPNPV